MFDGESQAALSMPYACHKHAQCKGRGHTVAFLCASSIKVRERMTCDIFSFFSLMNSAKKADNDSKRAAKNETLNIFSLASGHLYERFLR